MIYYTEAAPAATKLQVQQCQRLLQQNDTSPATHPTILGPRPIF